MASIKILSCFALVLVVVLLPFSECQEQDNEKLDSCVNEVVNWLQRIEDQLPECSRKKIPQALTMFEEMRDMAAEGYGALFQKMGGLQGMTVSEMTQIIKELGDQEKQCRRIVVQQLGQVDEEWSFPECQRFLQKE